MKKILIMAAMVLVASSPGHSKLKDRIKAVMHVSVFKCKKSNCDHGCSRMGYGDSVGKPISNSVCACPVTVTSTEKGGALPGMSVAIRCMASEDWENNAKDKIIERALAGDRTSMKNLVP